MFGNWPGKYLKRTMTKMKENLESRRAYVHDGEDNNDDDVNEKTMMIYCFGGGNLLHI